MSSRVFLALIVLMAGPAGAAGRVHRRGRTALAIQDRGASVANHGAQLDSGTGAGPAVRPLRRIFTTPLELQSARVENDLTLFKPTLIGITLPGRGRDAELLARTPARRASRFYTPARVTDDLEVRRDRDRLLLFRGPQAQGPSLGIGLAMFGATTILSAHLPRPLRVLFDRPIHLGPAIFDGGGMGAGIAGRGL